MSCPRLYDGCTEVGCKRPHHANGLCSTHYKALKRGFRDRNVSLVVRDSNYRDSTSPLNPPMDKGILCKDCHLPAAWVISYQRGYRGRVSRNLFFCDGCVDDAHRFIRLNIASRNLVVGAIA